ncbi:MAG: RagB/SusD family nutrient uptake outer membrane protein [Niabella sp.]|nr:RagB/SusD family nutrient uptake outer membrane protein [Niabella sp.]
MRRNNYKIVLFFYLLTALSFQSCKKYLDVTPQNVGTLDYAFRNRSEAENYLFSCYGTLQRFGDVTKDPSFTTSGETMYPLNLDEGPKLFDLGFQLMRGTQNISKPVLNFWDGDGNVPSIFQAIRRCNIMLDNINKPIDLSASEKARWIAELKFLKAYYHYYLARIYGPIPIYKTEQDINTPIEQLRVKRQPVDSAFSYAVQLINEAVPDLPVVIGNISQELGRITQPIALAVKAEILATAASPLFNGNPDYASYKNKDGQLLFSSKFDASKWDSASAACKAAIDAAQAQGIALYQFVRPANIPANLPAVLTQELTIQNAVTERWDLNQEVIWDLNMYFNQQTNAIPRLTPTFVLGVPGTLAVPISTTEMFYTNNGVPINEDNTWDYPGRLTLKIGDTTNKYYIQQGYTTIKANFNREPRFYANIGFDGGIWYGNGTYDPKNGLQYIQAQTGPAATVDGSRLNVTAIWPKKLAHYQTVDNNGTYSEVGFRIPRMRLADLYLLYAECLNESGGPSTTVYNYIDSVRARAGLQGVVQSWANYSSNPGKPLTKDGLRKIIHQERRIELCFEARSGWDLRRWKEWTSVMAQPFQGWSFRQNTAANFYVPVTQFLPSVTLKDYFWPLSDNDMQINNNLVQSPYW